MKPPAIASIPARTNPAADPLPVAARPHNARSLRRTLMLVLVPGLMAVALLEIALTWRTAVDAADAAYDRSLLGAIKAIDANISTDSGGLAVELPYRMLEFFELTANGRVYFRVATENGLAEIGNAGLPPPASALVTGQPQFIDTQYFGEPVRMASYARLLDRPLVGQPAGQQTPQRVLIQIAETLQPREAFTRTLLLQSLTRDGLLVLAASAMLVVAVGVSLRPLARLRNEVRARSPNDLRPISPHGIPADVQPLVEAINHHVARIREQAEARRRFVDDASHQLRTPLATLATQVGYALRESDPAEQRLALAAIKQQLDEAVRQTNQMLALARADSADSAELQSEPVDLSALAQELVRRWWSEARERGIDLGYEEVPDAAGTALPPARAQALLLREAVANLVHNAIRYTPRGSQVTVQVGREGQRVHISVVDNGPGMATEELARAGERFFRGRTGLQQPGSGLGLAIVKSIVERQGGELLLAVGPQERGLQARMWLPALVPVAGG